MHIIAHSTRPSHRLKINNQPLKKFMNLAVSWVKIVKNGKISDFQSQFSMSKIIWIFPNFFFIEEYKIRSTTYINDTVCLQSFLKHFIYQNWVQISNLNFKSGIDQLISIQLIQSLMRKSLKNYQIVSID